MKFFDVPFAEDGDKTIIPVPPQPDGSVSYLIGFGTDYELPNTDINYKPVPRDGFNQIFFDITSTVGYMQRTGFYPWQENTAYPLAAVVPHGDRHWKSRVEDNVEEPSEESETWVEVLAVPSDTIESFLSATTAEEARGALGLGNVATLSVGTLGGQLSTNSMLGDLAFMDESELQLDFSTIRTPMPISPLQGSTGLTATPELIASEYAPVYSVDDRDYREFQVDIASGDFSAPIRSVQVGSDTWTVTPPLTLSSAYRWRTRDVSVVGDSSNWSEPQEFAVGTAFIAQPSITSPTQGQTGINETPTFTSTPFEAVGQADAHSASFWEVRDSSSSVVHSSGRTTVNLTSYEIPSGVLQEGQAYTVLVRYEGSSLGLSEWSPARSFTTADQFLAVGPGPSEMIAYDPNTDTGYYGEVSAAELIAGNVLAAEIGLSQGTAQHSNAGWLKFYVGPNATCWRLQDAPSPDTAYVVFIAKRPFRSSVSWNAIYQAGAVYGTDDDGLYPVGAPVNQLTTIDAAGFTFKVQLITGADADPVSGSTSSETDPARGEDSYWNDLIYRIHVDEPARQPGNNWATFSNSDIVVATGNGRATWTQETLASSTTYRVFRGSASLSYFFLSTSTSTYPSVGWRPCLVIHA